MRARRHSTLVHRVLRLRLVHARPDLGLALSFQFLNRQVVWEELNDLLLFLLPVVNEFRLRRLQRAAPSPGGADTGAALRCALCGQDPVLLPCAAQPCGHVCCYFCLAARCRVSTDCRCGACFAPVTGLRRLVAPEARGA